MPGKLYLVPPKTKSRLIRPRYEILPNISVNSANENCKKLIVNQRVKTKLDFFSILRYYVYCIQYYV